ncbi:hypothetical protein P8C59_005893 [Phyllachora maydis]|uniref:LsmAD domain-containing protein n=1 Tax=Phyllachora maydis TaxID=1825666 RepID=A0AAD9I5L5_9PEZI|nr:hypothetical protein P8C59_005893 [Phyllachora maydis]
MSVQRKDVADARPLPGNAGKTDGKAPNGGRSFRTDTAISNARPGAERVLKPWVPDSNDNFDGSLESSTTKEPWDQFATHEKMTGKTSDYDANIYTTRIDKTHPQYQQRLAAADRVAREIEGSAPTTAHVAEERVMDCVGGNEHQDEEDKYSGVRRQQDFPPLANRENKYTPPARRAPTGQATVKGAPVDPAIISSQLKTALPKSSAAKSEDSKSTTPSTKGTATPTSDTTAGDARPDVQNTKAVEPKKIETQAAESTKVVEIKGSDKTSLRPSANTSRTISPQAKEGAVAPSATSTVERDVLQSFKTFATQQRQSVTNARNHKIKQDSAVKIMELKKFAESFKLSTPVPKDLVPIIAKDPVKQKAIQEKAMQNVREVERQKDAQLSSLGKDKEKESATAKDAQPKPCAEPATSSTSTSDARNTSRPMGPQHLSSTAGPPTRHPGPRNSYGPQSQYTYNRNGRGQQHQHGGAQQNQQTGNLAARIREKQMQQQPQHPQHNPMGQHLSGQDLRMPPTGPANIDASFNRRASALPLQGHLAPRLNPNSHEFRPNASAPAFNPTVHTGGQLIRRKTKAVDVKKCFILSHIETIQPPQGRNWDDNDGLRPAYDTLPTWRQLQDEAEKPDSTMHITYKEYFEKHPFSGAAMVTPTPAHVMPIAHQHQLPFHLQHAWSTRQTVMNQYRSFSNSPQFVAPQPPHMGAPVMVQQQQFAPASGMMPSGPQVQMYPAGGHPQFMPPGNGPPQPMAGANGFPSPGRPAATIMVHQGSHQGQPVYGMSPGMQYQQPAYHTQQLQGKYAVAKS